MQPGNADGAAGAPSAPEGPDTLLIYKGHYNQGYDKGYYKGNNKNLFLWVPHDHHTILQKPPCDHHSDPYITEFAVEGSGFPARSGTSWVFGAGEP